MNADFEAIVVGGGPAGSTLSAQLADAGHKVLLLDKARFPRFKACSDYVNPAGAELLDTMGVLVDLEHLGAEHMEGMVVHAPNGSRFIADYARAEPGRAAIGISRTRLDALLLQRAKDHGVNVVEGAQVQDLIRSREVVSGVTARIGESLESIRAPLVIGADGRNSVVRRSLGLEVVLRWPRKTGLVAHFRDVSGLERMGEMHVGSRVYGGLAMIEDGVTNLTIVAGTEHLQRRPGSVESFFAEAIEALPELAWKLRTALRIDSIRGVGSMACRSRHVCGDGFMLVGDAASFLDPFAGEGVYEALMGAHIAAPIASSALRSGEISAKSLAPYRDARRQAFTAKRAVSWIVQGFVNNSRAMNYVTPRLAEREDLGLTLSGVLGNFQPARRALSPIFLARLLRP
jgi:2-polyprenyl-6-methoxyphenol hydroxylase-like FAD-dependent oxidoreductase